MRIAEAPVHVTVTVHVNPQDVYDGLNSNDEATLNYVCQLVALTHSSDLRWQLLSRLGVDMAALGPDGRGFTGVDINDWQDEDYLPDGPIEGPVELPPLEEAARERP